MIWIELLLFRISNWLYQPSYISLESALGFYHFIPEAVYRMQAITTRKTITYTTPAGTFNYRSLKPALYFGYRILHKDKLPVLIAEPEKALLDYQYLTGSLNTIKDMQAQRMNYAEMQQTVDRNKLAHYAQMIKSKTLDKRIKHLEKLLHQAHTA